MAHAPVHWPLDPALHSAQLTEALDRMWPRLSPHEFLHDLLGARALLAAAGKGILSPLEVQRLYRPRSTSLETVQWTVGDAALIEELVDQHIDAVYASDLARAHETATALATAKEVPLCSPSGLREINFGDWEGLRWNEVETSDAQFAERWLGEYPSLAAPNGEAVHAFEARVMATFKRRRSPR